MATAGHDLPVNTRLHSGKHKATVGCLSLCLSVYVVIPEIITCDCKAAAAIG